MTIEKSDNEKFCHECGKVINTKAEICPHCGVRQMTPPITTTSPSRVIAILLGLFLGGLGLHKFYMGKTIQGLFYLLFCWTGIPAIIGLIEAIVYCFMSEETFASYCRGDHLRKEYPL